VRYFEAPSGLLGKLFNAVVLTNYMTRFLEERNAAIKKAAEVELTNLILQNIRLFINSLSLIQTIMFQKNNK
jgi:hypothetical protein